MRFSLASLVCLAGIFFCPLLSPAQTITFKTFADTSTPIPAGYGNFTRFSREGSDPFRPPTPAIDNNRVSFFGYGFVYSPGYYLYDAGNLSLLVNSRTTIPGRRGQFDFTDYNSAAISGANAAINADGGIYLASVSSLIRIADTTQYAPDFPAIFNEFTGLSFSDSEIFFAGRVLTVSGERTAIYRYRDGALNSIVNDWVRLPGRLDTFQDLQGTPHGSHGSIVFWGADAQTKSGIYLLNSSNQVSVIADTKTPIPGTTATFTSFPADVISSDGADAAFVGYDSNSNRLIVKRDQGVLRVIAREGQVTSTGDILNVNYFTVGHVSLSNHHLAFDTAMNNAYAAGIFTDYFGDIRRVIGTGDILGGKEIQFAFIGPDALDDSSLAFFAHFKDNSEGIYVALLPEPSALIALPFLYIFSRRRRTALLKPQQL